MALLDPATATTYADWFAILADSTRVRLLHGVASSPTGSIRVGDLAAELGISQATCSHHVRRLAEAGFVVVDRVGTASLVSVNPACCTGLPHAADVVMGTLSTPPSRAGDLPDDVATRPMTDDDLPQVLGIYAEGIATRQATFETQAPDVEALRDRWLPDHRWVAEVDDDVVGWAAAGPTSSRACYAGVAETTVYVSGVTRGRGVGRTLLHRQVTAADPSDLWTLQAAVFPENRASLALHRGAGYRILGVRSRVAQLDGAWRDTVLLERRRMDSAS